MDPWSKVDYSRHIREASMAIEKLPEMNPPSGRVPGHGLLAAPILKRQWRRNREGIAKKGSFLEGFGTGCKYRPKGGGRGWTRESRSPPRRGPPRARHQGAWGPCGPALVLVW